MPYRPKILHNKNVLTCDFVNSVSSLTMKLTHLGTLTLSTKIPNISCAMRWVQKRVCWSQSVSSGLFMDVMLWGRMSCVLVQHHVKMLRITDVSYGKTRGRRFPPGTKLHLFNTVLHMNTLQGPWSTISSASHCGMVHWLRQFCFMISCQTRQQTVMIMRILL